MKHNGFAYIGKYKFRNFVQLPTGRIEVLDESDWQTNLVTDAGRALLQSRIAANTQEPIKAMAVGTGTNVPLLANTTLQTETVRKATTYTVDGTPNWKTIFNALFSASEINGATEIGLLNSTTTGGTLVTRSKFSAAISIPDGSNMGIDYALILQTARMASGWTLTSGRTKTYEIAEANDVKAVIEVDTGIGYNLKTSVANVEATAGTYYYDSVADKLYVHASNNADPDTHTIEVITGG